MQYKYKHLKESERKAAAQKTHEDGTAFYTVYATGNTFPIKDDLQSWGFFWDADNRRWTNECASEFERFIFELHLADNEWPGIDLEFIKHKSLKINGFGL